jgi:hypothetical protein
MGEALFLVSKKVGKDIVDVTGTAANVVEQNMQFRRERFRFGAKPA